MIISEEVDKLVIAAKLIENCGLCACSAVDAVKYCEQNVDENKIYFFTKEGWKNFFDIFSEYSSVEELKEDLEGIDFNEYSEQTTFVKNEITYVVFYNSEHKKIVCVDKTKFLVMFE